MRWSPPPFYNPSIDRAIPSALPASAVHPVDSGEREEPARTVDQSSPSEREVASSGHDGVPGDDR